jgi:hypothetical protein
MADKNRDSDTPPEERWINVDTEQAYDPVQIDNIKSEWDNLTVYLPEPLRQELEVKYREMSYECMRSHDYELTKLREFYPLVVALGLENVERIDDDDVLGLLDYINVEYTE